MWFEFGKAWFGKEQNLQLGKSLDNFSKGYVFGTKIEDSKGWVWSVNMKTMEVSPLIDSALQNKPMTVKELQHKVLHFVQVVWLSKKIWGGKKPGVEGGTLVK